MAQSQAGLDYEADHRLRLLEARRARLAARNAQCVHVLAILKRQREWCEDARSICEYQRTRCRVPRAWRLAELTTATRQTHGEIVNASVAMRNSAEYLLAAIRHLPSLTEIR